LTGSIDRLQLQRAIDKLPPGYRTVFVLHDVEGFEHNEIAEMVGLLDWQQQVAAPQGTIEAAGFFEVHESRKGQDWITEVAVLGRGWAMTCSDVQRVLPEVLDGAPDACALCIPECF
jgi:hypothetical protein